MAGFDIVSYSMGRAAGGGGTIVPKTITANGTYNASADNADGYDPIEVKVGNFLPDTYQEVQYLGTTGTQYIAIPITFQVLDLISIGSSLDSNASTSENRLYGVHSYGMSVYYRYDQYNVWFNNGPLGYNLTNKSIIGNDSPNTAYSNISRDTKYVVSFFLTQVSTSQLNTQLGRIYDNNAFSGKLYNFSIQRFNSSTYMYEDFIQLIPCYRKSDNVAGFYDIVSGTFRTNSGTGSFVVGPDVT